ncbi:histidinol-phosphate transaminase [Candidatus Micrarchaeota archaeon]|nr:histidinol-phosphate transaminase [Candidatus Micrarchaeota archaeon]
MKQTTTNLEPYAWEASSRQIAREQGLDERQIVRFDMNTSPYLSDAVRERIGTLETIPANEYPSPDYGELLESVGQYCRVDPSQVVLGAGADEVIDTVAKNFLQNGGKSVISTPTYSMFRVSSQTYGAKVVEVPRADGFALDTDALADASKDAALAWVCNPNSPTGNAEPVEKIRELLEKTECTVILDEAYGEFGGQSALPLVDRFEKLIVVRTLSKAFGLAGARVGYAVTNQETAERLNRVRLPNSLSSYSAELARTALSPAGVAQMKADVARIAAERGRVQKGLGKKFKTYPSVANFLLVDLGDSAEETVKALLEKGLVVRNLSEKPQTRGCIRITVRSRQENDRLLEALI